MNKKINEKISIIDHNIGIIWGIKEYLSMKD